MKRTHSQLESAIRSALAHGQPPMEAAILIWEKCRGTRMGLNDALVALSDEGILQGEIVAGDSGVRRVLRITSISKRSQVSQATDIAPPSNSVRRRKQISVSGSVKRTEQVDKPRRVFVVHGRDEALKDSMFAFLRAIDLRPFEWHELTASMSSAIPYIGDILDRAFEQAQAIIVLFTPDEEARLVERLGREEGGYQARANVLFEAGLAIGRNPNRTVVVEVGDLRHFSDLGGRHVVRLNDSMRDSVARRQDLAQRLLNAGCKATLTGTDWHTVGNFRE